MEVRPEEFCSRVVSVFAADVRGVTRGSAPCLYSCGVVFIRG